MWVKPQVWCFGEQSCYENRSRNVELEGIKTDNPELNPPGFKPHGLAKED